MFIFFFFKQNTAYYMVRSDWSSDVCSSDLATGRARRRRRGAPSTPTGPTSARSRSSSRSEERRVGKECFVPCRSRWTAEHQKKNKTEKNEPARAGLSLNTLFYPMNA